MNNSNQKPTTLYRYYDKDGKLLYVGITGDNTKRQSQHRRNAFWFGEIASATFEHFGSRQEALDAESRAIDNENPKHNVARGAKIKHDDFVHMIYLAGNPDNGHDKNHKEFAKIYQPFFMFANGNMPSPSTAIAFAMKKAQNMKPDSKNFEGCEICQQAYSSDWYEVSKKEITAL